MSAGDIVPAHREYERAYDLQPAIVDMAKLLANSPLAPDAIRGDAGATFSILVAGHGLRMNPAQSLQSFDFIKGKPYLRTEVMAALFLQAGHSIAYGSITASSATVRCTRGDGRATAEITYTHAMAERAGLTTKDNWRKHPQEMLTARALRAAMRMTAPDVFLGAISDDDAALAPSVEPVRVQIDSASSPPAASAITYREAADVTSGVPFPEPYPEPPPAETPANGTDAPGQPIETIPEPVGVVIPMPADEADKWRSRESKRQEAPITRAQISRIYTRLGQISKARGDELPQLGSDARKDVQRQAILQLAGKSDLDSTTKLTVADGTHVIKALDAQLADIRAGKTTEANDGQ